MLLLPLILRQLPPEQLGLWFVFGTLGGLAVLLDLGFEPTVTRMASYAWAGVQQFVPFGIKEERYEAPEQAKPNRVLLTSLLATLRAYYLAAGLLVLLLLGGGGGAWVWMKTEGLTDATQLRAAWVVYAGACCLHFVSGRWPALLIAIGHQRLAEQIGIVAQLAFYLIAIPALIRGWGIWALVGGFVVTGAVIRSAGSRAFRRRAALEAGFPRAQFHPKVFSAIWPNAWRMGLVSVGSYLILQANTLICSAYLGLEITASYGLSLQLVGLLIGVSQIWVMVKLPQINQLRVHQKNKEILTTFVSRLRLTVLTYLGGAVAIVIVGPWALNLIGSRTPLLPPWILIILLFIRFLEMHHSLYAMLVLSENRNPFFKPALISGAVIVALSLILTPRIGVWGLLISTGLVQACYNNWWPIVRALRGLDANMIDLLRLFLRAAKQ